MPNSEPTQQEQERDVTVPRLAFALGDVAKLDPKGLKGELTDLLRCRRVLDEIIKDVERFA